MSAPTQVFFDIGGVLLSNGWDREQRQRAVEHFGLDADDFLYRHEETVGEWESGRMTAMEYLDVTVFHQPRAFGISAFVDFMLAQSAPFEESLAVVRELAGRGRVRLATLNNEAEMLNEYRIARFDLRPLFSTFCSSCWLGVRKPGAAIYYRALRLVQAAPEESLLVDDREQNLAPAAALGMRTIHFRDAAQLRRELGEAGLL
jgi:putative hydrolase of the HAD superfamily